MPKIEKHNLKFDSRDEIDFYELILKLIAEKKSLPKEWFDNYVEYDIIPMSIEREKDIISLIPAQSYNGEEISQTNTKMDFTIIAKIEETVKTFWIEIKGYNRFRKTQEEYNHALIIEKYVKRNLVDYAMLSKYNGSFQKLFIVEQTKNQKAKDCKKLINNYFSNLKALLISEFGSKTFNISLEQLVEYAKTKDFCKGYKRHKETKNNKKILNFIADEILELEKETNQENLNKLKQKLIKAMEKFPSTE